MPPCQTAPGPAEHPRGTRAEQAASQHPPARPGPPTIKRHPGSFPGSPHPRVLQNRSAPAPRRRCRVCSWCCRHTSGAGAVQDRVTTQDRVTAPPRPSPGTAARAGVRAPPRHSQTLQGNRPAKAGGQQPPRRCPCPHPNRAALTVWGSCWGGPHARGGCTGHPEEPRPPGSGWGGGGAAGLQGPDKLSSSPARIPRTVLGSALAAVQCPVPDPPAPRSPAAAGSHARKVPLAPAAAHGSVPMHPRAHVLVHQHTRAPMHRSSRAPAPSCSTRCLTADTTQPCGG